MSSSARPMEAPEQVMGSHSSSSTGECPSYPSRSRSPPPPPPPPPPLSTATTTTPTPTAVALFKRKRTKRLRASPTNFPSSSSTSSLEQQLPSATEVTTTTTTEEEEEEDMAHCLILLAQGRPLQSPPPSGTTRTPPVVTPTEKFTSRKFTETVTTAGGKAGFYVYECKTCSKCFPSFQALGGHRASHKKPKMAVSVISMDFEDKKQGVGGDDHVDDHHQFQGGGATADMDMNMNMKTVVAASSPNNAKVRVHECSICGAEFSSGQALGGHMRRHRPIIQAGHDSQHVKKENSHVLASSSNNLQNMISHNNSNVLTLDLNLPAPSEELNSATTTEAFRSMVFSSALVDCHY